MTGRPITLTAIAALAALLGCDNSPTGPAYDPQLPTSWAAAVTHPHFALVPGTTWTFESQTPGGLESIVVEVLPATRMVNGVAATVVRDRVYLDGELIEDTYDWYAQDDAGNVWYLGEDTREMANGQVVSTDGSFEWGVDGALPGIIMWSDPAAHIGEEYRQEFYEGEAEDWGRVVAVGQSVTIALGTFTNCVQIEEWNGLEPGPRDHKYYCPQMGVVLEIPVGGGPRVELVARTP